MENGIHSRSENNLVWIIIVCALGLLVLFVAYSFWPHSLSSTPVTIGAKTFYADVANTEKLRTTGLSEHSSLPDDQAFLMTYDTDGVWPVKASSIGFPVDIVWINQQKQVVYIAKETRPTGTGIFKPGGKSRYVLLLPAGSIDTYNIRPGKSVKFEEN